jgi:hypothetical protein
VYATPRADAQKGAERHDREREPVAGLVVRLDRLHAHVAQPRIDEALGEHRARVAAVLIAIDVDQVNALAIDEHVEVVAIADHDARTM